jgi:hypothetical protein
VKTILVSYLVTWPYLGYNFDGTRINMHMSIDVIMLRGESRSARRNTCTNVTLPATNPTCTATASAWASATRGRRLPQLHMTLHHVTLRYIILYYIILYIILYHISSHHIILYYIMLYYIILYIIPYSVEWWNYTWKLKVIRKKRQYVNTKQDLQSHHLLIETEENHMKP